jgi:hypothetical protein
METERDFLSRCIPYMIKEENRLRDAAAICYSIYRREGTETKSPKPEKSRSSNRKNLSYDNKRKKAHILILLD